MADMVNNYDFINREVKMRYRLFNIFEILGGKSWNLALQHAMKNTLAKNLFYNFKKKSTTKLRGCIESA